MQKTAIIIPCYNESKRLNAKELIRYAEINKWVYFIFINDGSSDDTLETINQMCRSNSEQMLCVDLKINVGKAEAVRQGFVKAIDLGFYNIGYWDADLSTPLEFIDRMVDKINDDITFVLGSRVKLLGYKIERLPLRHYAGRLFGTMASIILGLPVYDTQCGAKIFRNNLEIQKAFSNPFTVNWSFDVELIGRLKIIKREFNRRPLEESAREYPLEKWIHHDGSKVRAIDFLIGLKELLSLKSAFRSSMYVSNLIN